MKRRTLDIVFAVAAVAIASLLFVLGFVLSSDADFSKDYVKDQLTEQKLTFKEASELSDAERAWTQARTGCLFGEVQGELRTKITAAKADDPQSVPALEKQLTDVTTARETVFEGEMLRGALLSTYGMPAHPTPA